MIESLPLLTAFTVVFGLLGLFHLRRCAVLWSGGSPVGTDRTAELGHLLMSVAMIGMAWTWGGPGAWWLQLVVFGVLAAFFVARTAVVFGSAGRMVSGYHALAMAAMTWMVVAMPLLGHSVAAGGSGGHHHGGAVAAGPVAPAMPAPPMWVVAATVVFAAALAVSTAGWVLASLRAPAAVRVAGWCHALMGTGMAAMLLVMVYGEGMA